MDTIKAPVQGSLQPDLFGGLTPELIPVTMRGYEVYLYGTDGDIERLFSTIAENAGMAEMIALEAEAGFSTQYDETEQVDEITRDMVDTYNQWLHNRLSPMFEMKEAA